ncbi:SAP domain-containing protein [Citrus sinensis]|uniref:SAP domain-containing protein n=2 Tax=Citrus sinensis TaxID=2711 RepID=A0ACB8LTS3_CITSI|nr:SAP domain-containing protein [Citrus sinensis]KDO52653.1 hypothetical protein CISIN_1g030118mg [Citrus sinensis]
MEASSSQPQPSDSNQTASSFLANLPSRGLFTSAAFSPNQGGMRVYICEHDTSPPEDQLIKTNQQNILIRSLTLKKQKGDPSSKDVKGATVADRKRTAERILETRTPAKRANCQTSSQQEGSNSRAAERDFHSLTVERLRALLKEKGLSPKGKKACIGNYLNSVLLFLFFCQAYPVLFVNGPR